MVRSKLADMSTWGPSNKVGAFYKSLEAVLLDLPEPVQADVTVAAQDILDTAKQTVEAALTAAQTMRRLRLAATGKKSVGRLSETDVDLLRSAVVFAGAGLDATLEQLVQDSVELMIDHDRHAKKAFRSWVSTFLDHKDTGIDKAALVEIFLHDAPSPRAVLVSAYRKDLTGGSLQSVDKVEEICTALGIAEPSFRRDLASNVQLREMFDARNQIAHDLDLTDPDEPGRRRHDRTVRACTGWAQEALAVTQGIVNRVAASVPG